MIYFIEATQLNLFNKMKPVNEMKPTPLDKTPSFQTGSRSARKKEKYNVRIG